MKILPFPELRQAYDYDCGANASEAVLAYYGFDVNEGSLMKQEATTKRSGTPAKKIVTTFKKYNLKCRMGELTINQIKKYIDKKIPVILLLQAWTDQKKVKWETDWIDGHYVVVIGYDKNKFYFADPSSVLRTYLTYDELEKRWHDTDGGKKYINYGIIAYGKKPAFNLNKKVHMD